MNIKKYSIFNIVLLIFSTTMANGQISINGTTENIIYDHVKNQIEYTGNFDCDGLTVEVEGFEEPQKLVNCSIEITYLKSDTSKIKFKNTVGETIFETTLIKDQNRAKGFVRIGGKLLTEGSIKRSELAQLEGVVVQYSYPWLHLPKIYRFHLILVDKDGTFLDYEVYGAKISEKQRAEIRNMEKPVRLYIEQINWVPISCFEKMNSIVIEIE